MAKSEKKFRELILLVCSRSEHDTKFGAIKLNKILFHSDFSAYLAFGKPISGQEYFKLQNGPAPKQFLPVSKKMQASGDLAYKETEFFGHMQKKPIALRQPDVSVFSPEEIDIVHKTIQKYWNITATAIGDHSHLFIGWRIARDKETIPYATALVSYRKPSPQETAYGLELEPLAQRYLARANG